MKIKKMFDRKKGRLFGINLIDLLVLLIIVFGIVSYLSRPTAPVYQGNQMFVAIQDFQRYDSRGFLVEAEVNGTFLWDETPFSEKGLLLSSSGGRLRLKKQDGTVIVFGGEGAYLEDVAASTIKMEPKDRFLMFFNLDANKFDSYEDLVEYLGSIKSQVGADRLYVDIEIAVDAPMTPSERQSLVNQVNSLYLVRNNYFSRSEDSGFVLNLIKAELDELKDIAIPSGHVTTNDIRVFAGYDEEPDPSKAPPDSHTVDSSKLL